MITNKPTTIISYSTAAFVFLVATGAFVLSFANLWDTALAHGLPPRLAWIWPLLVDFALVVFSLAVVRASLHNERTWWPWLLVAIYTVGTIGFNVYHAPDNLTARVIAVVAPVSLFLSFETLMGMLKSGVRRNSLVQSISQITAKLSELEGLYQGQKDKLEGELKRLERERLAEIEAQAQVRQTELDALIASRQNELDKTSRELETAQGQITQAQTKLSGILGQIEGQNIGQKDNHIPIVVIGEGLDLPKMKPAERQKYLPQLLNNGVGKDIILNIFGISAKTLDRDIKECNGAIIQPVDVPGTYGRNGNGKAGK